MQRIKSHLKIPIFNSLQYLVSIHTKIGHIEVISLHLAQKNFRTKEKQPTAAYYADEPRKLACAGVKSCRGVAAGGSFPRIMRTRQERIVPMSRERGCLHPVLSYSPCPSRPPTAPVAAVSLICVMPPRFFHPRDENEFSRNFLGEIAGKLVAVDVVHGCSMQLSAMK